MSFKEFGRVIRPAPEKTEFKEFGEKVEPPSRLRSLISAPIKGLIKGTQELTSLSPFASTGPIPKQLGERILEEFLPTEEKLPEEFLERAGRLAPSLAGGGEGLLAKGARAAAGSALGMASEKLGAPEWIQSLTEGAALGIPSLSKKIPLKSDQIKKINFLRSKGFTENEISPFLKSEESLDRLASFARKGKKVSKLSKNIYSKLGGIYEGIKEEAAQSPSNILPEKEVNSFLDEMQSLTKDISPRFRRLIKEDVNDLLNSDLTFNDFTNFYHDINANIGSQTGGKAVLGRFKEPVNKVLSKINPELAEEFYLTNEFYGKGMNILKHLKPKEIEALIDAGELYTLAGGIADQNFPLIKKVLGLTGARTIAREMMINPRLQNISQRMLDSIKNNKTATAIKLFEILKKDLSKESIEFIDSIE